MLDWMDAHRGRHVDIGVGMMQCVKAPEKRHRVLAAVHEVAQQIEQQEARHKAKPGIGDRPGRKSEARQRLETRPDESRWRNEKGGKNQVQDPEADIAEPAPQSREFSPPPRPAEFPQGDDQQAAEDREGVQRRLLSRRSRSGPPHPHLQLEPRRRQSLMPGPDQVSARVSTPRQEVGHAGYGPPGGKASGEVDDRLTGEET